MRADIPDHELVFQPPLCRERGIARGLLKPLGVDPVDHDRNLITVDAATDQVLLELRRQRDDGGRLPVQKKLETLEHADHKTRFHRPDGNDRCRPDIAKLKNEGTPATQPDRPTGDRGKELR